jgi:PAS domain S-box-containing protein
MLNLIVNIGKEILLQDKAEEILEVSHFQINKIFDIPLMAIGIFNQAENRLDFIGHQGVKSPIINGSLSLENDNHWSVKCFKNSEEIIISKYHSETKMSFSKVLFQVDDSKRKSFLYLPLIAKSKTIGVLTLQSFKENEFTGNEVNFIRIITNYISIAIENACNVYQLKMRQNELQSIIENMEELIIARTLELEQKNKELERISIVAEKTENAIMLMDEKGNILWINDYFTLIYGYSLAEFIKVRGNNILQTSFNPDISSLLSTCIMEKRAVYYDALNVKCNGQKIWAQTSLTPILGPDGNIKHLVTIDSDITSIKNVEEKLLERNNEIMESLEYARRIQRAAFPSIDYINKIIPRNFIFWKPLDIVSGDFYWTRQKNNRIVIVVGDCTGHGVPGALLSMMGCSFLEEILSDYSNENAADILQKIQFLFEKRLRQRVMGTTVNDGMDVGICVIDLPAKTLSFAGANLDLVFVDNSLHQFKGNRMCIGRQSVTNYSFTNHVLNIDKDYTFYMFTDGYYSQFGGEKGKKFKKSCLLGVLEQINGLAFPEQKNKLKNILNNWMQSQYSQIDDILIFGFKIL